MNPKLRSLATEDYSKRGSNLFGPGFQEKASKRIKLDKAMSKVSLPSSAGPASKKRKFGWDRPDLRYFLDRGSSARYGSGKAQRQPPYQTPKCFQSRKYFQTRPHTQDKTKHSSRAWIEPFLIPNHHTSLFTSDAVPNGSKVFPGGRKAASLFPQLVRHNFIPMAVRGYSLELDCQPRQAVSPPFTPPPPLEAEQVQVEISKLLNKVAVRKVSLCTGQFVNRIFMVTKKDGSCRLVVNLKPLNQFVTKKHFKMENAAMVRSLLRKDGWMTTIDHKDAFLSVPIQADHRKFLHFQWKGALYEFQCLLFGLTSAPRVFTKLLRPVMAVLRRQGIRCMTFIDDLLLLHPSREELKKITAEVVTMFLQLGFLINQKKSGLIPLREQCL